LSLDSALRPIWRTIGCLVFFLLLPLLVILAGIFHRPEKRSAEEVVRSLRDFVDVTCEDWDFDDFISIPLADPRLESIRHKAMELLGPHGWEVSEMALLLKEAETIVAEDRARLIDLLRAAIAGSDVTDDDLAAAFPYPHALGRSEFQAYETLSHWIDDDDIRARDAQYVERQRNWMAAQLAALEAASHSAE